MKLPEIKMVAINRIAANPYRDLQTYPVIRSKVDSLKNSIATVGMWESIIARPKNGGYEQAFGHQRIHAARELEMEEVPVIVKDLTDEQMIQYMGRENGEDYSADFLIMLNTWDAATKFGSVRKIDKAVDIARLLGWVEMKGSTGYDQMSQIARACAGATALIEEGYLDREDLEEVSVSAARHIVERALSRMDSISRSAKISGAPAEDVKHAKSLVGKGAKATVKEVRKGEVPSSKVASRVDVNTLIAAGREKGKRTPYFDIFGRELVDSISKILDRDSNAEKLAEIVKVVSLVAEEGDKVILRQLDYQLGEVADRANRWRRRLSANTARPAVSIAMGGPR